MSRGIKLFRLQTKATVDEKRRMEEDKVGRAVSLL